MNYNEFISTYLGKAIDYDGGYGVQCVDLIKLYLDKVFNLKIGAIGNAHVYFDNYDKVDILKNNFTRIANTPDFIPNKGDIVVWSTAQGNGCGHIAIASGEGTTTYFYSYEQNWNGKAMKKVYHTYTNVLGVLRPKDQTKINGGEEEMKRYKNGSTVEDVFADTNCTNKIGSLNPREECDCFGIFNDRAMVRYQVTGTNNYKIGFCKWTGRVQ